MTSSLLTYVARLSISTLLIAVAVTTIPALASGSAHLYGPVGKSETLQDIASRIINNRDVNLDKTMADIRDANPDIKITGNEKPLQEGSLLKIPEYLSWNVGTNASLIPESSEAMALEIKALKRELSIVKSRLAASQQQIRRYDQNQKIFFFSVLIISLLLITFTLYRYRSTLLKGVNSQSGSSTQAKASTLPATHQPISTPSVSIPETNNMPADIVNNPAVRATAHKKTLAAIDDEPTPSAPLTAYDEPTPSAPSTAYDEPTPSAPSNAYDEPTPAAPSMALNDMTPSAPSMALNDMTPSAPSMALNDMTPSAPSMALNDMTPSAPSMALNDMTPAAPSMALNDMTPAAPSMAFNELTPSAPNTAFNEPTPPSPAILHQPGPAEIMDTIEEVADTDPSNASDISGIINEISDHFKGMSNDKHASNLSLARIYLDLGDYSQAEPLLTSVHNSSIPEYAKQAEEMIHELLQAKLFASSFNKIINDLPDDCDSTVTKQLDGLTSEENPESVMCMVSDSFMPHEEDAEAGRQMEMAQIFFELGDLGRCKQHLAYILGSDNTAFQSEAFALLKEINTMEAQDDDVTTKAPLLPGDTGDHSRKQVVRGPEFDEDIDTNKKSHTDEQLEEISSHFMAISSNTNGTKLALATVHHEMGKREMAQKLVNEIINSGDKDFIDDAKALRNKITG